MKMYFIERKPALVDIPSTHEFQEISLAQFVELLKMVDNMEIHTWGAQEFFRLVLGERRYPGSKIWDKVFEEFRQSLHTLGLDECVVVLDCGLDWFHNKFATREKVLSVTKFWIIKPTEINLKYHLT